MKARWVESDGAVLQLDPLHQQFVAYLAVEISDIELQEMQRFVSSRITLSSVLMQLPGHVERTVNTTFSRVCELNRVDPEPEYVNDVD